MELENLTQACSLSVESGGCGYANETREWINETRDMTSFVICPKWDAWIKCPQSLPSGLLWQISSKLIYWKYFFSSVQIYISFFFFVSVLAMLFWILEQKSYKSLLPLLPKAPIKISHALIPFPPSYPNEIYWGFYSRYYPFAPEVNELPLTACYMPEA